MIEYFADVFGVQFPVCSLEQKQKLEAAFKSACEYEKTQPAVEGCECDLIIALLSPDVPRAASIVAAWGLARETYTRKQTGAMLLSILTPPPPQPTGRAN